MMPTDTHRQSVSIKYDVLQMSTDKFKISNWEKNIAQDVIPGRYFFVMQKFRHLWLANFFTDYILPLPPQYLHFPVPPQVRHFPLLQ